METYVVSGLPRSGTSAAMGCLHRGLPDVPGDWDPEALKTADKWVQDGYVVNPNGFYESTNTYRREPDWYLHIGGMLTKVMVRTIVSMGAIPNNHYRIMYMYRDYEPWCKSWKKTYLTQPMSEKHFNAKQTQVKSILYQREDCSVTEVNYAELVEYPHEVAHRLNNWGWKIQDIPAFCSNIDKNLRRNG